MKTFKIGIIALLVIGGVLGIGLGMGWFDVFYTKTVGKAKQNAEREVFEETQSFVEGKRQEALKLYREYLRADSDEKVGIEAIVAHSFANFNEEKLTGKVYTFVYNCKYKVKHENVFTNIGPVP